MSYYTNIYPTEDFKLDANEKELCKAEAEIKQRRFDVWETIIALAVSTPSNKEGDFLTYYKTRFDIAFNDYLNLSETYNKIGMQLDILDNRKYYKEYSESEEEVPVLSVSHYEYNSNPESGIEDLTRDIEYVRNKLLVYVMSTPKDIIKEDKPVDIITNDLFELKEFLDEALYTLEFTKLCIKYWSTHTEG